MIWLGTNTGRLVRRPAQLLVGMVRANRCLVWMGPLLIRRALWTIQPMFASARTAPPQADMPVVLGVLGGEHRGAAVLAMAEPS